MDIYSQRWISTAKDGYLQLKMDIYSQRWISTAKVVDSTVSVSPPSQLLIRISQRKRCYIRKYFRGPDGLVLGENKLGGKNLMHSLLVLNYFVLQQKRITYFEDSLVGPAHTTTVHYILLYKTVFLKKPLTKVTNSAHLSLTAQAHFDFKGLQRPVCAPGLLHNTHTLGSEDITHPAEYLHNEYTQAHIHTHSPLTSTLPTLSQK